MNPTVEGNISAIEISPNQFEPLRGQMAQNYGFASRPVSGCHHFVITVNGNSGSALSIATNDTRYRPQTLAEGETTMHDNAGQYVLLQGGQNITILANQNINVSCSGAIEIDSPNGIKIVSPTVHMTGNLNVDGDVTGNNGAVSLDSHVHTNVTTGSNNSGKPYGGV
jgi:phage gp45-like